MQGSCDCSSRLTQKCHPAHWRLGILAVLWLSCVATRPLFASTPEAPAAQENSGRNLAPVQASGQLRVIYAAVKDPEYGRIHDLLHESGIMEKIASAFNQSLALPADVVVYFKECGEPNVFYDHDKKRITFCYELIERIDDILSEEMQSDDELEDATVGATAFMVYHELAHALLRVLDLPLTGKTEDSVDQLSAYLLARGEEEAEAAALDGVVAFHDEDTDGSADGEKLPFWSDHSLNTERFYRILCWIYGHDDEAHADLVEEGILPRERAASCRREWEKISKTWSQCLGGLGRR